MRPLCIDCQKDYEAEYRKKNAEKLKARRAARREKEKIYRQEYDAKNRGKLLVGESRRRSRRKGIPFDLDDYLGEIERRVQAGRCEMTGLQFNFHSRGMAWNSPSMDRINPKDGYVYKNIRIVCFAMNAALGNWGEETLRTVMDAWFQRR